jgi:hypothetical protein
MLITKPCVVKGSNSPPAIGIETEAVAVTTAEQEPIPIELVLTPMHAAELLVLLLDLQRRGHIPRAPGRAKRTTRH